MEPLELKLGDGWTAVAPQPTAFGLAFIERGGLKCQGTDFRQIAEFDVAHGREPSSQGNCPVAVDDKNSLIYWARTKFTSKPNEAGCSSLVESDLRSGKSRTVLDMPSGKKCNWLLTLDEAGARLITQVHGAPKEPMLIAFIDIASGAMRSLDIGHAAWLPLAVFPRRRQFFFSLRDGSAAIFDFDGKQTAVCPQKLGSPNMDRHPSSELIAVSFGGIYLWNLENDVVKMVSKTGNVASWSADGRQLWYFERDSELWVLDIVSGNKTRIIQLSGDTGGCTEYGNLGVWSPDGRFLLAQMNRKCAVSKDEEKKRRKDFPTNWEPAYQFDWGHHFCVVDTQQRTAWTSPGHASHISWFSV